MKVAIVTGSSKGIGKACALKLAKDGYTVVINYSNSDEAAQKVLDQVKADGGDGMLYKADVSDLEQVKKMFRDVAKAYGQIDVLVNNAGIVRDEYLLMLKKETMDKCFDLNIKGYVYCAQRLLLRCLRRAVPLLICLLFLQRWLWPARLFIRLRRGL